MMLAHGFVIFGKDKCIYNKLNNNEGVIICLCVDNLLIFGTNHNVVHDTKFFFLSLNLIRKFWLRQMLF